MMLLHKCSFTHIFWYFFYLSKFCDSKSVTFIDVERPVMLYSNPKFLKYGVLTSRRISRQDPRHYVDYYCETVAVFDNNLMVNVYFYQFLTNRYRPSFIELHLPFCEYFEKDQFLGPALREFLKKKNYKCPLPPGQYNITHAVIPSVPKNFPFTRGRIYVNTTVSTRNMTQIVASAYIDMEIKQVRINAK